MRQDFSGQYLGVRAYGGAGWMRYGKWVEVDANADDVLVIRDPKEHREFAFEIRDGQTAEQIKEWALDRMKR